MPRLAVILALLCALALVACGGGDSSEPAAETTETAETEPAEFPRPEGKTLAQLRKTIPEGPVFAPAVSVLDPGENRFAFALFDQSRKQVTPEAVAVYAAPSKGGTVGEARGPFMARQESLNVSPQFRSRQTQADLDEVDTFWVADVNLPKKGSWVITALASMDGELVSASQFEQRVGVAGGPPDVGDKAVKVATPTPEDVAGDLEQIDTRIPPSPEMHETSFEDVVGKKPVVLVFATPQLCQTRVCGPAVDIALETKHEVARDDVEFIHMEIFRDNEIAKGLRPQPAAWRLPTEPWTFLVGSDGRIKHRFEGAFSVDELRRAVADLR